MNTLNFGLSQSSTNFAHLVPPIVVLNNARTELEQYDDSPHDYEFTDNLKELMNRPQPRKLPTTKVCNKMRSKTKAARRARKRMLKS